MPPSGSTLLGRLLGAFTFTLSGGYTRSVDDVLSLLLTFATIELGIAAIAWGFTRQQWVGLLFWKMLGFATLAWIVENWPRLAQALLDGFIEAGLVVGGSVLSVTDIKDPGNIVDFGFSVTAVLAGKLGQLNLWNYGFEIIVGGLCMLLIIMCYILLAALVFKALLEYAIAGACLLFLVPFLAYEKTAPFGERVFGTFVAHAFRLLLYAAILSCALPILYTYHLSNDPKLAEVGMLLAASFILFFISLSAPAIAGGLLQGSPVLNFSHILHGATSVTGTASAVGSVGSAAGIAVAGAARGALSAGSAVRAAAQLGAAQYQTAHPTSSGVTSSLAGGAGGVGTYAAHRLTSGFRAAIQAGRTRAAEAFPPPPKS